MERITDAVLDPRAVEALVDASVTNNTAAIHVMEAFINAVEAQSGNQIPAADAVELTDFAAEIIAVLSIAG